MHQSVRFLDEFHRRCVRRTALNDRLECVWGNVCVRVEKERRNGLLGFAGGVPVYWMKWPFLPMLNEVTNFAYIEWSDHFTGSQTKASADRAHREHHYSAAWHSKFSRDSSDPINESSCLTLNLTNDTDAASLIIPLLVSYTLIYSNPFEWKAPPRTFTVTIIKLASTLDQIIHAWHRIDRLVIAKHLLCISAFSGNDFKAIRKDEGAHSIAHTLPECGGLGAADWEKEAGGLTQWATTSECNEANLTLIWW